MQKYLIFAFLLAISACGSPLVQEGQENSSNEEATAAVEEPQVNGVKDLYVIRKVVYEIGILTDADNNTDYDNKTHEQIDISFFDPKDNGSFIDLSNIPLPLETNVTGTALTGILPSNLGKFVFSNNGSVADLKESNLPVFPDKQVKVTKNISTNDQEKSSNILSGISDVLGLTKLVKHKANTTSDNSATN
ncbi:unnamed protein product [Ceutorhynchus assimilis]|uniref:Lipoprotein n=1 Tax=Ceutorhynchus assimilis TaxID=467358 RepID=A0A9N9MEK3_9CUCU|nr:unnamed protein product [Ceutorhynchus assimilis]